MNYKKNKFIPESNLNSNEIYNIINEIKSIFKNDLINYKYINDMNKIEKGGYLKYIDLNLNNIKGGVVVNLIKNRNGNINLITLKNTYHNFFWKINPTKVYIFFKPNESTTTSTLRCIIKEYLKK